MLVDGDEGDVPRIVEIAEAFADTGTRAASARVRRHDGGDELAGGCPVLVAGPDREFLAALLVDGNDPALLAAGPLEDADHFIVGPQQLANDAGDIGIVALVRTRDAGEHAVSGGGWRAPFARPVR